MHNSINSGFMKIILFSFVTVFFFMGCQPEDYEKKQENSVKTEKKEDGNNEKIAKKKYIGMEDSIVKQKFESSEFTEIENIEFSDIGVNLKKDNEKGILISTSYKIPLIDPEPGISIGVFFYGDANIIFQYQLSKDNINWNDWQELRKDNSSEPKDKNRKVMGFNSFAKENKYIRYMIIIESGKIEKLEVFYFSVGIMVEDK